PQPPGRRDPVEHRHAQVHQDDVGPQLSGLPQRLVAVAGLADDGDVGADVEEGGQRFPKQCLIVNQQHTYRGSAHPGTSSARNATAMNTAKARFTPPLYGQARQQCSRICRCSERSTRRSLAAAVTLRTTKRERTRRESTKSETKIRATVVNHGTIE